MYTNKLNFVSREYSLSKYKYFAGKKKNTNYTISGVDMNNNKTLVSGRKKTTVIYIKPNDDILPTDERRYHTTLFAIFNLAKFRPGPFISLQMYTYNIHTNDNRIQIDGR